MIWISIDMEKDFQAWHDKKQAIHSYKARPFFREREVWICSMGTNIGFEEDGSGERFLRPVVILKKLSKEILWGLPLTKTRRVGEYYFQMTPIGGSQVSVAMFLHLRSLDSKRLFYKIGDVGEEEFLEIKKRLTKLIG